MYKQCLTLASIFLLTDFSVYAHESVAHVDLSKVARSLPGYDSVQSELARYVARTEKRLQTYQSEYTDKVQQFERDHDAMLESERELRAGELRTLESQIVEYQTTIAESTVLKESELSESLIKRASEIIQRTALEQDISYVFAVEQVRFVYLDPSTDLTPVVLANVREDYGGAQSDQLRQASPGTKAKQ